MSRFQRVQQWSAFSKSWYLYDAKWQNPFHSARKVTPILEGKSKPIYSPGVDCWDHIVIINSKHISLLGREWKLRVYFHHPGYNKVSRIFTSEDLSRVKLFFFFVGSHILEVVQNGYQHGNYIQEIQHLSCGKLSTVCLKED